MTRASKIRATREQWSSPPKGERGGPRASGPEEDGGEGGETPGPRAQGRGEGGEGGMVMVVMMMVMMVRMQAHASLQRAPARSLAGQQRLQSSARQPAAAASKTCRGGRGAPLSNSTRGRCSLQGKGRRNPPLQCSDQKSPLQSSGAFWVAGGARGSGIIASPGARRALGRWVGRSVGAGPYWATITRAPQHETGPGRDFGKT